MDRSGAILAGRSRNPASSLHLTQKSSFLLGFGQSGMDKMAAKSFHAHYRPKQHTPANVHIHDRMPVVLKPEDLVLNIDNHVWGSTLTPIGVHKYSKITPTGRI